MAVDSNKTKRAFKKSTIFGLILLAVIVCAGFTSFYIVDETEQAVITRFGKYVKTVNPGIHFKLPFNLEKNYNVPVTTVLTEQFGFKTLKAGRNSEYKNNITEESTMLTGDLNLIEVEWTIQYQIEDPKAWLFNVYEKETTVKDISRSVINTLVGDRAIVDVMGTERTPIETLAKDMMNEDYKNLGLGIKVLNVKLLNTLAPVGVKSAFEDVTKANQDMNTIINEGKEAYYSEIPKAKGEADRQIQIAEGYATERINKAKGDVARFNAVYEEYRKAPKVTKQRIYLETMEEIFNSDKKPEIVDSELNNILPIKELKKRGE